MTIGLIFGIGNWSDMYLVFGIGKASVFHATRQGFAMWLFASLEL